MRNPVFWLLLLMHQASFANELPSNLKCKITGHAGCSDICVGAGVKDDSVKMYIDTKKNRININGIKGLISDTENVISGNKYIYWKWSIIGLNQISFRFDGDDIIVNLSDGESELEFSCLSQA